MLAALAVAMLVSLFASSAPVDQRLRLDQTVFVGAGLESVPTTIEQAEGLPGSQARSLPHDWRLTHPDLREGWYFLTLTQEQFDSDLISLWVPRLAMNAAVYLNGIKLAEQGNMHEPVDRHWNRPLLAQIPASRLLPTDNLLAIRVVAERGGQGLLREVYVGPDSVLRAYHEASRFFSETLLQLIIMLMLVTSSFMALLWWWGRRDPVYGWYALMMSAWAIHDLYPVITTNRFSPLLLDWFWHVSLVWFVYSVCVFVFRYLHLEERALERRFFYWTLSSTVGLSVLALVSPAIFYRWGVSVSDTVTLVVSSYPLLCVSLQLMRRLSVDMAMLVFAGAFALLFGIHDWLMMNAVWDRTSNYLMPYGSPAIMIVFGVLLTRRFGVALNSIENLNKSLEAKVQERELQINRAHERLLKLQTERAITDERERLVRDMHDGVGGTLVSTLAMVKSGHVSADSLQDALQGAIEDLRLMIDSLDPVDGDLVSVLANLRSRLTPRLNAAGLQVIWGVSDLPSLAWLGPQGVLSVMRILQEGINNVLKHAHATAVEVSCGIDEADDTIWIKLVDNGVGLNGKDLKGKCSPRDGLSQCLVSAISGGRGLTNMKSRALSIGAELEVKPNATQGTTVLLRLPIQAPNRKEQMVAV